MPSEKDTQLAEVRRRLEQPIRRNVSANARKYQRERKRSRALRACLRDKERAIEKIRRSIEATVATGQKMTAKILPAAQRAKEQPSQRQSRRHDRLMHDRLVAPHYARSRIDQTCQEIAVFPTCESVIRIERRCVFAQEAR